MAQQHTARKEIAVSLAETLFTLEEPWRSRFLSLVASQATDGAWNGPLPTKEQVTAWLNEWDHYRAVALLLNVWRVI